MATNDRYSNLTPYAIASYSFKGEAGELSFEEGEVIELTRIIDGEWIEGRKGRVTGLCPLSYLQVIIPPDSIETPSNEQNQAGDQSIGIAFVLHDFIGESGDELSVRSGSQVKVIHYVNEEWVRCYDPSTDGTGIIPLSFVQIYSEDEPDDSTWSSPVASLPAPSFSLPTPVTVSEDGWNRDWDLGSPPSSKKSLPPRPPAPSKIAIEALKEKREKPKRQPSPMRSAEDKKDQTGFVVEELMSSEHAYFLDMMSFVSAVNESGLSKGDSSLLCGMMSPLIQLSVSLHESVEVQNALEDTADLCVGRVFIGYRKSFSQVYSFYFRQLDAAYKIIEREDNIDNVKGMISCMKKSLPATSCLEMTSTLMRPIQRCLKYPLLLTQLIKTLPLTHSDHPKLVDAVKQMSNLASKMNESRRRRELVDKYSKDGRRSIGERISTINLHSLHKKSSRFTTRLGKTIGVIDLPKDSAMDSLLARLFKVERTCVHFVYYLTVHIKKVQSYITSEKTFKELLPDKGFGSEKLLSKARIIVQNWTMNVNLNVRYVMERAIREIPKKLLQKREDKLLDYYNALKKSSADLTEKKREYDALSVQLRQKLPSIINSITRSIQQAYINLRELHSICEGSVADAINEERGDKKTSTVPISRMNMERISTIAAGVMKEKEVMEDTSVEMKETKEKKEKEKNGGGERVQTAEDRMNVWNKMSANTFKNGTGVFRVDDITPVNKRTKDDLVCSPGDIVYVEQSTKRNDRWECWNGQKKGLMDASCLSPVSLTQVERPQSTPLRPTPKRDSISVDHKDLFSNPPPQPNLLDLDSPSECSIPVLKASNASSMSMRVPSLPSLATLDPFDAFSTTRMSTVSRPPPPLQPIQSTIPLQPSQPMIYPSLQPSTPSMPFNTVSHPTVPPSMGLPMMPSLPQFPPSHGPSLSTRVLQPTRVSSPIRVTPLPNQSIQLSATNPFRDMYDTPPPS